MQRPRARQREIEIQHNREFPEWFTRHVDGMQQLGNEQVSNEIIALARGPSNVVRRYSAYVVRGFRFHTKTHELSRKTQNSGVVVTAKTQSYSSSRDRNPIEGDVTYYGVLQDIIDLEYLGNLRLVLFKCQWYNVLAMGRGIRKDEHGFTLVNSTQSLPTNEPFVLASQVEQVFYVEDPCEKDWLIVIKTTPRDFYDMFEDAVGDNVEEGWQTEPYSGEGLENPFDTVEWVREDVRGTRIDTSLLATQVRGVTNDNGDDDRAGNEDAEGAGNEDADAIMLDT